jgi:hypothetical protein
MSRFEVGSADVQPENIHQVYFLAGSGVVVPPVAANGGGGVSGIVERGGEIAAELVLGVIGAGGGPGGIGGIADGNPAPGLMCLET